MYPIGGKHTQQCHSRTESVTQNEKESNARPRSQAQVIEFDDARRGRLISGERVSSQAD